MYACQTKSAVILRYEKCFILQFTTVILEYGGFFILRFDQQLIENVEITFF